VTGEAPRQLTFDLPLRAATGAGDFLVSGSNEAAVALVESWPDWPHSSVLLLGPAACGKSHLATVWQDRAGAITLDAPELSEASVHLFQADGIPGMIVENIDRGIGDERVLFHLLNHARETRRSILLTSRAIWRV
jgi:chromosomal replication initiation ATPase DnaA